MTGVRIPLRLRITLVAVAACAALLAVVGAAQAAPTVTSISSLSTATPDNSLSLMQFYLSKNTPTTLSRQYLGFRVTNDGSARSNLWVKVTAPSGGNVQLAPGEDGLYNVGALGANGTRVVYFLFTASAATATDTTFSVELYEGVPAAGGVLIDQNASLAGTQSASATITDVVDSLNASANKVLSGYVSPSTPTLGSQFQVVVNGLTGTIANNGRVLFTPAFGGSWDPSKFELISTSIAIGGSTFTNQLAFKAVANSPSGNQIAKASQEYTATYTLRAIDRTAQDTKPSPVGHFESGTQMKYTNASSLSLIGPIEPVTNAFVITASVSPTRSATGLLTYTLTLSNTSTKTLSVDLLRDVLPAGTTYRTGTSRYNGAAAANPSITGGVATWSGPFSVGAGSRVTLSYQVQTDAVTSSPATYTDSATGMVGSTLIDTTLATTDNVPATATSTVSSTYADDTTAPTVTLTAYDGTGTTIANAGATNSTAATMAFTANEAAAFTCSLDGTAPAPCTSPFALSGLRTGSHTFYVYATDTAGNVGTATITWTVRDATKPEVLSFASAEATTKTSPVQFRLKFTEEVTGLAAGDFTVSQTTTSGWAVSSVVGSGDSYIVTLSSATVGTSGTVSVTLAANAVSDLAGTPNTGPSANAASNAVTVSNTLAVEIREAESSPTAGQTTGTRTASIAFGSTAGSYPASRFMCSMQPTGTADSFAECVSPATYSGLASGTYVFKVRGEDVSVSDTGVETIVATSPTVQRSWTVDATAPTVTITAPTAGATISTATPAITGACTTADGAVTTRIYAGAAATGTPVQTLSGTCDSSAYTSTPSDLVGGTYTAVSTQTDAYGNTGTSAAVTFTVSLAAPTVTVALDKTLTRTTVAQASGSCKSTATTQAVAVRFTRAGVTTTLAATCSPAVAPSLRTESLSAEFTTAAAPSDAGTYAVDASGLADGVYTVTSTQTDTSNGLTGTSLPATLVVDTVPPPVTISVPANNARLNTLAPTVSGACETGTYSGDGTISITFTPTGGASGTRTATATCADGAYSGQPSGANLLVDGVTYAITASQTDTAGNVGTSSAVTTVIDTTAPTVTITSPATGSSTSTNPTISGACESGAGSGTGAITVTFVAGVVTKTATGQCTSGTYTATPDGAHSLSLGTTYTVTAQQTDAAGNTGTSAAITLTATTLAASVDLDPASDTGASSTDHLTKVTSPAIIVSGVPSGGTGTVTAERGATTATCTTGTSATGSASCTPSLSEGTWSITAVTTSTGGATSAPSAAITVVVDSTAPASSASMTATHTRGSNWPVDFTASDANGIAQVAIVASTSSIGSAETCGVSSGAATSGTVTCAPSAPIDATYAVASQATDAAGNVETVSATDDTIVRDTAAPTVTITTPATTPSSTTDRTPTIAGACDTDGGVVTITITPAVGSAITTTATCTGGAYTVDAASLTDGTYRITAAQTDAAGNTGTSTEVALTVDATGPAVTIDVPAADAVLADTTPTIEGTCETAGGTVTVRIYVGATATGTPLELTATCTAGYYSATVADGDALDGGTGSGTRYTATATQADALGNATTTPARGFTVDTFVPDTTAPTVVAFSSTTASPTQSTTIAFSVTFSEDITDLAAGDITLSGTSGGTGTWTLSAISGSGTGPYTFTATNASAVDGTVIATLAANAVADTATSPNRGPAGAAATTAVTIDRTAPAPTIVHPTEGARTNDATPTIDGACQTVDGTVTVQISSGGSPVQTRTTSCTAGAYTVDATTLASGTYGATAAQTDAAGNSGSSATRSFTVDLVAPTVTDVTSTTPNGTYRAGDTIAVNVTFSEAVTPTGTPQIGLAVGTTRQATYTSQSTATTLAFTYAVQAGDTSADLDYAGTTSLALAGGTILDAAGNAAALTLPTPGAAHSLAANKAIVIDAVAPTVTIDGTDRTTNDATPTLTGTCSENGRTVGLSLTRPSGTPASATATCATGTYTATPDAPLADAAWTVTATHADAAGNSTDSAPVVITVDTTGPELTITRPTAPVGGVPWQTGDTTPQVAGACETGGGRVTVRIYNTQVDPAALVRTLTSVACTSGGYTATASPALVDGLYAATAQQADALGNATTTPTRPFRIDSSLPVTPPVVTITSITRTANDNATIAFAADRPSTYVCRLNGGAEAPCTSPITYAGLAAGVQTFEVRAIAIGDGLEGDFARVAWDVVATTSTQPSTEPTTATPSGEPNLQVQVITPDVLVADETFTGSIDVRNVGTAPTTSLRVTLAVPQEATVIAVRPIGISPIAVARTSRRLPRAAQDLPTSLAPCTVEGLVAVCNATTLDPNMRYRLEVDMRVGPIATDLAFVGAAESTNARGSARRVVAHTAPEGVRCTIAGEGLIRGTRGNDVICGSAARDRIFGLGGNDRVYAGASRDLVYGGGGVDRLLGGDGADRLDGGHGADVLLGEDGRDMLLGRQGDDALNGGKDADELHGGLGRTRIGAMSPQDRHFLIVAGAATPGWDVVSGTRGQVIERLVAWNRVCTVAAC